MKKIVVKVGSSIIAPGGGIDLVLISALAKDILEAQKQGAKVILVSSGAIACGASKLGLAKKPSDTHTLMALASLGQIILMDAYVKAFAGHNKSCAQILLSWDDFDSRKRFLNARKTIDKLLEMDVVPVINENDAVSDDEIKFGDNDRLSALVGDVVGAEMLIILSDIPGLMDEAGKVIEVVPKIDSEIYKLVRSKNGKFTPLEKAADFSRRLSSDKAGGGLMPPSAQTVRERSSLTGFTSGGMNTKLQAAEIAVSSGIKMVIADGKDKMIISRIAAGEACGTAFLPQTKIKTAKKRWIAFSKKAKGKIHIDDGAKDAVINRGKSLLGVGITKVEGEFKKKDSVCVVDSRGNIIGCGLVNYSYEELTGNSRKKLEKEVIHRNNFVKTL